MRIARVSTRAFHLRNICFDKIYRVEEVEFGKTMAWLNKNRAEEHLTFAINDKGELAGAAVYGDQAGEYIDLLTIINKKLKAKDLSSMIFSFPTTTYGLVSSLIPLMLKK